MYRIAIRKRLQYNSNDASSIDYHVISVVFFSQSRTRIHTCIRAYTRFDVKHGNEFFFLIITNYVIRSSKWQKAAELIGNKCEGRVTDLAENMKYTFRVIAVNKGGFSKPSEPSDPVITKDRNGNYSFCVTRRISRLKFRIDITVYFFFSNFSRARDRQEHAQKLNAESGSTREDRRENQRRATTNEDMVSQQGASGQQRKL